MLSYSTVEPHTLELLRKLTQEPLLQEMRLVGGTALTLQYGHRMSVDLDFIDIYFLLQHYSLSEIISFYKSKYPEHSVFRALMSLTYFDDAEEQIPPKMFEDVDWEDIKTLIRRQVDKYTAL